MTDPIETGSTQPKADMPTAGLEAYFTANRHGYTDEALAASARASGYSPAAIAGALAAAKAAEMSAPLLARARVIVLFSYLLVYAVLVIGMLTNPSGYGAGAIGTVVLTVTLVVAWLISVVWIRRRGRKIQVGGSGFTAVLALPVVLLVIVAGSCIATGLPIPRTY